MMACRRAMRATPIARVMVSAAGSPSGIAPTARVMAASMASTGGWRYSPTLIKKVSAARARIAYSSSLLKAAMLRVSGVSRLEASAIRREIRPISVWSPVATTTPRPCPAVTKVAA